MEDSNTEIPKNNDNVRENEAVKIDSPSSPYDNAGFFGRAVFTWLSPFVNEVASTGQWDNAKYGSSTPPLPNSVVPQTVLYRFEEELKKLNKVRTQERKNDIKTEPSSQAAAGMSSMFYDHDDSVKLLTAALYRVYWKNIVVIVLLLTLAGICWLLIPALWIRRLVVFSEMSTTMTATTTQNVTEIDQDQPSSSSLFSDPKLVRLEGFLYAFGLMFTELVRSLCIQNFWFRSSKLGCEMKTLIYSLIFSRSIALRRTKSDYSVSELVNLCSNDGERLFECARMIPTIFLGLFLLSAIAILGYIILGPSILAGVSVILFLVPLQLAFARFIGGMRKKGVKYTNERVGIMTELLTNIKLVKMYNWELPFNDKVAALRQKEQSFLVPASYMNSIVQSFSYVLPTLSSVVTFVVHVSMGNTLTADSAFAIVGLFNTLVMPLSVFPLAVRALAEGRIGWQHLGELLVAKNCFLLPPPPSDDGLVIEISNATFDWETEEKTVCDSQPGVIPNVSASLCPIEEEKDATKEAINEAEAVPLQEYNVVVEPHAAHTLTDLNIRIYPKELVGVCGAVGSGKSSFCSALIGGINCLKGSVGIQGTIGYVSQLAWILPNTVKENILFGNSFDAKRYEHTIDVCCLKDDLKILAMGDNTLIGERGVNLSGGQKQRIALARAVYSNRDIYILDDPLSAVDPHVSKRIFHKCLLDALKDKTVVFVTHQLQYLSGCDKVIFIENGHAHMGRYQELISTLKEFESFLTSVKDDTKQQQAHQKQQPAHQQQQQKEQRHQQLQQQEQEKQSIDTQSAGGECGPSPNPNLELSLSPDSDGRTGDGDDDGDLDNGNRNGDDNGDGNCSHSGSINNSSRCDNERMDEEVHGRNKKQNFSWATLRAFGQAGDGLLVFIFVILLYIIAIGGKIFSDRWLVFWISQGDGISPYGNMGDNPRLHLYLSVYIYSAVGFILLQAFRAWCYNRYMLRASTKLHNQLVRTLMFAPLWFFDTKPIGHILARVSKDLDEIDVRMPVVLEQFLTFSSLIILTLFLISYIFPYFACGLPFIGVLYVLVVRKFSPAQIYSKKVENKSAGPVISHIVASLEGIYIIQAFQSQDATMSEFWNRFDEQARGLFYFFGVQSWAAYRLDFVSFTIVSITALLIPSMHGIGSLEPGLTGLALVYANSLAGLWQATTRMGTEVAARITSVERVMDYINNVAPEKQELGPTEDTNSKKLPKSPDNNSATLPTAISDNCGGRNNTSALACWPTSGTIEFAIESASYRPGLPDVLHGITFSISAGETVGVVGRTGSGKSTLSMCLFRLIAELKGDIFIDGISTAAVSLNKLRSSLGIIPQEPVLFQGTIRYNLDPFSRHSDDDLWSALGRAHIKEVIISLPYQLDTPVFAGGTNFSVGERQLLCMARALLRDCKIMILDEATSSIDSRTDELIQRTIRSEFSRCTVLTIAHRIETIVDADRILVMDGGKVVEYDCPKRLIKRQDSTFRSMVNASLADSHDAAKKKC